MNRHYYLFKMFLEVLVELIQVNGEEFRLKMPTYAQTKEDVDAVSTDVAVCVKKEAECIGMGSSFL